MQGLRQALTVAFIVAGPVFTFAVWEESTQLRGRMQHCGLKMQLDAGAQVPLGCRPCRLGRPTTSGELRSLRRSWRAMPSCRFCRQRRIAGQFCFTAPYTVDHSCLQIIWSAWAECLVLVAPLLPPELLRGAVPIVSVLPIVWYGPDACCTSCCAKLTAVQLNVDCRIRSH